ncbi:uncharacterized protein LOC128233602 [Mya arenaria]|uniref:uncharacterized protein LOC128233602 n=1 Tax=Mya arenaria TaxID=6604 RepID=UPI0022DF3509|nr:uncharacterized protein LOC128233602 [Mya arenaria]
MASLQFQIYVWASVLLTVHADFDTQTLYPMIFDTTVISLHDPSSHNAAIRACQAECGDTYFRCLEKGCPHTTTVPNKESNFRGHTASFVIAQEKPGFLSRFLYYLTFGLFGARTLKASPESMLSSSGGKENPLEADITCHDACQTDFRKCWKDCFCAVYPENNDCKPVLFVYPLPQVPNRVTGATGFPPYRFKWDEQS